MGAPIASIAAPKAGTTAMLPPLAANSRSGAGPRSDAVNAAATAVHRATGSSSALSHDTHATRGANRSAHCARTVVFP